MPEVHFCVRWPDESAQFCTSPSTAIESHLTAGASYPVDEFLRRARAGLSAASERVREVYGYACTSAAAELDAIEGHAGAIDDLPARARVRVESMTRATDVRPATTPSLDGSHHEAVVIGAGQAGLAVSWCLDKRGVDHVVLERERIAHSWRTQRWDAFCLVTPNWQCQLPGHPYEGDDPDGFMLRDAIVDYVEGYAERFKPPVHEGVGVERVGEGFELDTSAGTITADSVVLAVGGYHRPGIPRTAERLPGAVTQLHSSSYRNADSLPDGAALVVGSGQSGAQIAEDLHLSGRRVHLSVGTAPRVARFHRGRDVVAWLHDIGRYDMPIDEHPEGLAARREANHYVTGRDGGRDIDLRAFAEDGMHLHGRLAAIDGSALSFAGDLRANLDGADKTFNRINESIDKWIDSQGIDAPPGRRYEPVWMPPSSADDGELVDLDAAGITTVIWATGFESDWSWVDLPAFDGAGYPTHERGVTTVPGLYVVGLPWLYTWGSGRFAGIARDAEYVGDAIAEQRGAGALAA